MSDNQQQPYSSDSAPRTAQPDGVQPSEDYKQQPYGQPYGSPQTNQAYGQQPQYNQPAYGQPPYGQQYGTPQPGQPYEQQYGAPQPNQPYGQPAGGYAQQPGYGQPYGRPNPYTQPQYAGAPYGAPAGYSTKSKLAAGLFGIFLGAFGVHNFYLGNTTKAVCQLLLTLVGWILLGLGPLVAAIWGLVEGILILCSQYGSPWHKDANGHELTD